jgi:hypothetical protein
MLGVDLETRSTGLGRVGPAGTDAETLGQLEAGGPPGTVPGEHSIDVAEVESGIVERLADHPCFELGHRPLELPARVDGIGDTDYRRGRSHRVRAHAPTSFGRMCAA